MARPNVVVILTDQQRRDSLGCYGNTFNRTPNLDAIARSGVRFERCYVANPICMPSRASIFTGKYPRNHGVWTNGLRVHPPVDTMAEHFARNGYETAAVGKLHFTPYGADYGNLESRERWLREDPPERGGAGQPLLPPVGPYGGFERVELTISHTAAVAHYGRWFRSLGGTPEMMRRDPETEVRDIPAALHDSTFVGERAAAFVRRERDRNRPFFLVASFPDPHHPFDPPRELAELYPPESAPPPIGSPDDLATRPEHYRLHFDGAWARQGRPKRSLHPGGVPKDVERRRIANTAAMVELIDRNVGVILQALKEEGLLENTIVAFLSDHGELLGDHGLWLKGPFFYEGLVGTPLIISGPGVARGFVTPALFSHVDLFPTLAELAGLPAPEFVDGISQAAVLRGEQAELREVCLIEYRNGYGNADVASATLVSRDAKYTRYQTGEEELTDLVGDPQERTNRSGDPAYARDLERCRARLLDLLLQTQSHAPVQVSHA